MQVFCSNNYNELGQWRQVTGVMDLTDDYPWFQWDPHFLTIQFYLIVLNNSARKLLILFPLPQSSLVFSWVFHSSIPQQFQIFPIWHDFRNFHYPGPLSILCCGGQNGMQHCRHDPTIAVISRTTIFPAPNTTSDKNSLLDQTVARLLWALSQLSLNFGL